MPPTCTNVSKFVSMFCAYAGRMRFPAADQNLLPSVLRHFIDRELPARDQSSHAVIRDLTNSAGLACCIETPEAWCWPTPADRLECGVVLPYWRDGLHAICRTPPLYELVSWFFHSASQYVARGRTADMLGAIALTYGRPCDFRGDNYKLLSITPTGPCSVADVRADHRKSRSPSASKAAKRQTLARWQDRLNCLDPFVHRMVFHYITAIALEQAGFLEEAIVSLDKSTSVAMQFALAKTRHRNTLEDACAYLGVTKARTRFLKRAYQLRCYYGAHPGHSAWWDVSEAYGHEFPQMLAASRSLLSKLADAEAATRTVAKAPSRWSDWFGEHCLMLWDAVGYHENRP